MKATNSSINIYFRTPPETDRFIFGDRYVRPLIRRILRGKKPVGGVEKVFLNLCKGFDSLLVPYNINKPFSQLKPEDKIIVLGRGKYSLEGYNQPNPIIAGIGLMTHPSEWPDLCKQYPVVKYLQHCKWAADVYKPYYGERISDTWFAGIETNKWKPNDTKKINDVLIYNKIRWKKDSFAESLVNPIKESLKTKGISYKEIIYGSYKEEDYFNLLQESKCMIFLCEHESQGFACCEALSMNVPVIAWNQGYCLDPDRYKWGTEFIPATPIPFFDDRCGEQFKNYKEFSTIFPSFYSKVTDGYYEPRQYILENLTLEKSAQRMLDIVNEVYEEL